MLSLLLSALLASNASGKTLIRQQQGTLVPSAGYRFLAHFPFAFPGCYASGSALGTNGQTVTVSRAGSATYYDASGALQTCTNDQLRVGPNGMATETGKWQTFLNSAAPASHTTGSLSAATYIGWMDGPGSIQFAAGTAVGTGLPATATAGNPVTFTITSAGTIAVTVTGSPTRAQIEGSPASSFIASGGAATYRQPETAVTVSTAAAISDYPWCLDVTATQWPGRSWSTGTFGLWLWGAASGGNRALIQVSAGTLEFHVIDASSAERVLTHSVSSWTAGSSHRVTACNGADGSLELYLDGVGVGTQSTWTGTGIMTAIPTTLHLGENGNATYNFNGFLKGVRLARSRAGLFLGESGRLISAIGDSITAGQGVSPSWPVTLDTLLGEHYAVRNDATTGYVTSQMLTRWTSTVRPLRQTTLMVLGGINDVRTDVAVETIESNLQTMYDQALADGASVVAITLLPFRGDTAYTAGREANRLAVNAWIASYAASRGITVVDASSDFDDGTGALKAEYDLGDHLHPSQAGADRLAELVRAVFP